MFYVEKGTVQEFTLFSEQLQQEFNLLLYIPANYSPFTQYNLCIASDGRDYFQMGAIQRVADELMNDYEIEETIIVGVPYINAADRKRKYIPSGDQFHAYMHFIVKELVPYLEENYSISQDLTKRAIIGDSMAGTIALMTAAHYPDTFGKIAMQSPYVDDEVITIVEQMRPNDDIFIYHIIGLEEVEVVTTDKSIKDFLTPNRALHALIKEKAFPHFYDEFNGGHKWTYWKPDLKRLLTEIFE